MNAERMKKIKIIMKKKNTLGKRILLKWSYGKCNRYKKIIEKVMMAKWSRERQIWEEIKNKRK